MPEAVRNHFARIAAPEPRENEVRLVQDAEIWAAKLDAGVEAIHPLAPGPQGLAAGGQGRSRRWTARC